jgi:hypothetical protein
MPCYSPLNAFQCQDGTVVFRELAGSRALTLPCGQCVGCRLERSRQWAIRCSHEASLWERNSFITLTYNDENLPPDRGLHYEHFQKFMKRLRFSHKGHRPAADGTFPIRFYMCGEYGENFGRPHFHACIFNFDFEDKKQFLKTDSGSLVYRSAILEELWPFGYSSIGEVNFQSSAYVARYIMKKITGDAAKRHYFNRETGEIISPEFNKMSLKPGIGAGWLERHKDDVYKFNPDGSTAHDGVVMKGRVVKPPRYYDKKFKFSYPTEWDSIEFSRFENSQKFLDDNTPDRLRVKEQVTLAKLSRLKRKLT